VIITDMRELLWRTCRAEPAVLPSRRILIHCLPPRLFPQVSDRGPIDIAWVDHEGDQVLPRLAARPARLTSGQCVRIPA
jgi:hypothetical protein